MQIGTNGSFGGPTASDGALRQTNDVTATYAAGPQLFSVLLNGAPVVSASGIDLAALVGPEAYVGFTAATGQGTDEHRINRFSFDTTYAPSPTVPEPSTLALASAGLFAAAAAAATRRRSTGS